MQTHENWYVHLWWHEVGRWVTAARSFPTAESANEWAKNARPQDGSGGPRWHVTQGSGEPSLVLDNDLKSAKQYYPEDYAKADAESTITVADGARMAAYREAVRAGLYTDQCDYVPNPQAWDWLEEIA